MRYDYTNVAQGCKVWHVPECCQVKHVVWVDDETAEYEIFLLGQRYPNHKLVCKAKRIDINAARTLVLIDPIEDADMEQMRTTERQAHTLRDLAEFELAQVRGGVVSK